MSTIVLFHGNCIDGWFSAYLAHLALTQRGQKIVKMFPVAPTGTGLPSMDTFKDQDVLMVDVSFDEATRAKWLAAGAKSVHCIDHHETSKAHYEDADSPIHTECCASIQVFHHFFPNQEVPFWLNIVDRIDRWDKPSEEDRSVREIINLLAHKSIKDKKSLDAVLEQTRKWIETMQTPEGQREQVEKGKVLLKKKDEGLFRVLSHGKMYQLGPFEIDKWNLPSSWLGANLYLIDNSRSAFDTTEAAHVIFTHYPGCDIFINFRQKTVQDNSDGMTVERKNVIYYARSQTIDLTQGTIFRGHPTAAGASLSDADHYPFL